MPFTINNRCFEEVYITDADIYDRFVGGQLWMTGGNSFGTLGNGTAILTSSPVQTIAQGTNWSQISQRNHHTAAIKRDGSLWTWGNGGVGVLGDGTTINKCSPVQTISQGTDWKLVSAGGYHVAAIKTDGSLWLWGRGGHGNLATNNTTSQCSPVQTISAGRNWKSVSTGWYHTVALKTDGTLWTWGCNVGGQLGDGTTISKCSPIQTISQGNNWKTVSAGACQTGGVKTDGTLWLWGGNTIGQLGDGTTISNCSPVQTISQGNNWRTVSLGCSVGAGIKTDGTLWLWGRNDYGQLGNGNNTCNSSPVQTISQGCNWRSVDNFGNAVGAIKTDGSLWVWGRNGSGTLGDGTALSRSSPVQTAVGGRGWISVSMGTNTQAAGFITFREP